eukprot:jgi/Bigna1/70279/fgenesh1_pg.11_\
MLGETESDQGTSTVIATTLVNDGGDAKKWTTSKLAKAEKAFLASLKSDEKLSFLRRWNVYKFKDVRELRRVLLDSEKRLHCIGSQKNARSDSPLSRGKVNSATGSQSFSSSSWYLRLFAWLLTRLGFVSIFSLLTLVPLNMFPGLSEFFSILFFGSAHLDSKGRPGIGFRERWGNKEKWY